METNLAEGKKETLKAVMQLGGEAGYIAIQEKLRNNNPKKSFHKYIYNTLPELQKEGYIIRKGKRKHTIWKVV